MRKRLLLLFGCALMLGGVLALAWYAYLRLDAFRVQRGANRFFEREESRSQGDVQPSSDPHTVVIVPPGAGQPVGRLEIPRLHLSVVVLQGDTPKILRIAAGHIDGTALPGVTGNVGIAAHRDSFFRPLRNIRDGDSVLVITSYGTFHYLVYATEIVKPTDVQVLQPTSGRELTLITCYPFTYIGAAPKRFVIHARQQS